jgi:hypothetical protein
MLLFVVTAAIFGAAQARGIFEMNAIIDSPGVQDLIHQLRDEGRAEGRTEGRTEQARTLLLRLLRVRFGTIPETVVERVQAAELGALERWADQVLVAPTAEEALAERGD